MSIRTCVGFPRYIGRPIFVPVTTQAVRRAETRTRLLDAAAHLFATRGIDGSSIDAIADLADRTSGALYDHFGGKEGLLYALLEGWVDDVAVVINAELAAATTLDERLATLWRNIVDPPTGGSDWIALEHELWRYATRNETARAQLARRYQAMWDGVGAAADEWMPGASDAGPALIGLLLGLEMMRRVNPDAVTDELAIASLRGVVVGASTKQENAST
jgi:AcrR family transcriptional regulator